MSTFSKRKAGKEKEQKIERPVADLDEFLLDQKGEGRQKNSNDRLLIVLPPSRFYVDEQVRKTIDAYEIEQRAASMRTNGQLQPIIVYPADTEGDHKGQHKIDKGECRWRAAQLIEGFELKAIVDVEAPKRNKQKRMIGQIVENDQRADLRPLEMAQALEELLLGGMTQEEVAIELGWITRSNKPNINKVSRILSIRKLPEEGQKLAEEQIVTDLITLELLRKIYDVNPPKFSVLCDLAREGEGLSRKRAEQEYKQCKTNETQESAGMTEDEDAEFSHERIASKPSKNAKATEGKAANVPLTALKKEAGNTVATSKVKIEYPVIQVEWRGKKRGTLILDQKPEEKGYIWLKLEKTSDRISVELEDLKIKSISVE
jgi:ParB/RepB/Spo0J family partition protein